MKKYDFVVIGSGLGGLECALMLSKEGYSVCILEKNPVFGGCFQSFMRKGHVLDTGIHYVGSMDDGQVLNQYFKYFGILDKLNMRRLDSDAFDTIYIGDKSYKFALGFNEFADSLSSYFPEESANIHRYTNEIQSIYSQIGVESLRKGTLTTGNLSYFSIAASAMIEGCVAGKDIRTVLAGNSLLYGGIYGVSTLYHHAMVEGSNIAGAYRFVDGTQHVVDAFIAEIEKNGGVVAKCSEVTRIAVEGDKVSGVEINGGEDFIEANNYIADIHPSIALNLLDKNTCIKHAYYNRIYTLPNSYGIFTVSLIMKPDSFPYMNSNIFINSDDNVWYGNNQSSLLFSCQANSRSPSFSDAVTILAPIESLELDKWTDTSVGKRGRDYIEFKNHKAQSLIDLCAAYFPQLKESIAAVYTASPLTYRDYTGSIDGSAYGIIKNCNNPMVSLISSRTKLPNLYLTGQNLNVHGAVGVTLTAALTCSEFLGQEYLAKKIGDA